MTKFCQVLKWHLNTGPFDDQTTFDYLKNGQIWYSDTYCIWYKHRKSFYLIKLYNKYYFVRLTPVKCYLDLIFPELNCEFFGLGTSLLTNLIFLQDFWNSVFFVTSEQRIQIFINRENRGKKKSWGLFTWPNQDDQMNMTEIGEHDRKIDDKH